MNNPGNRIPSVSPGRGTSDRRALSFAQQRLWFLDQLEPGLPTYNIPSATRLTGQLHVAALEQSVGEIVRRHEALRTTFPTVEGQPAQAIASVLTIPLPVIDLQDLPETEREAEARRLATEDGKRTFDLAQGPLMRTTLLKLSEVDHILLLTMHHIISDRWSMRVLFHELSVLYEAFCTGKPSPLSELPIQYADFAAWQRQWLRGQVLESQLSYWKQQLGGSRSILQLPTDYQQPATQTSQGSMQSLVLTRNLTGSLKSLSRQGRVTLFMTLLAAFKVLLYRYTDQEDIIVGSPIASRNRVEIEGLIGFFVNTLVLRTDFSGNPTFRELLGRVREVCLDAYAHQDLPFEKLVEELQPERDLSRHPLFDILLNFTNIPQTALELPGIAVNPFLELAEPGSKFLMTLYINAQGSELKLKLVYRQALFSAERMSHLLEQFRYLLKQIVAAPDAPIRSYSLVTPGVLSLLPDPRAVLPEPYHAPVTSLFASWANRTPEHLAICQGDDVWTYKELLGSAHALARHLLSYELERGDVVAVFGPRSFGLVASMIGVLLGGGVLLTLDPNLPRHRQQLMLREAGAKHLLYIGSRRPEDKWIWDTLTVNRVDPHTGQVIDSERDVYSETIHLPELSPEDAAYIFFTSGSSGVPKGILGCHKGISHFLNWQRETFAVSPEDRIAQLMNLSFDAVIRDVFLPLISGATLCLPPEEDDRPDRVLRWLERERISLFHTVPSLAQSWLANLPQGVSLRALKRLFFTGEPLTDMLIYRWRRAFPEAGEIVNLYGPTETTLVKCYYLVPPHPLPGIQPAGSPLPETQALILAENNQLCGIGEPGEIVLRTPFRTLGYINSLEENQSRFIENPFRDDEQDLLYYTGDRGRYRPDGSLDILGRLDNQIKIRGVRIEPGEIETILAQHPAVWETVVTAWEDPPGDKRIVAYLVPDKEQSPKISELRRFVKQKLPEYMVPSFFVILEALPLTPNGKVDRRSLPVPDRSRLNPEETFVAPRTPVEQRMANIWSQVLGIEQVGVHDDFFALGGHSLLAAQVISRMINTFRVEVSLRTFFQSPTVADMTVIIVQKQAAEAEREDIDRTLDELEALSDVEAQHLIDEEGAKLESADE